MHARPSRDSGKIVAVRRMVRERCFYETDDVIKKKTIRWIIISEFKLEDLSKIAISNNNF